MAAAWHEHATDLGSLSWPLRVVIGALILATAAAVALIIAQDVSQPQIFFDAAVRTPMPTLAFVAAVALWLFARSFALTGALFGL